MLYYSGSFFVDFSFHIFGIIAKLGNFVNAIWEPIEGSHIAFYFSYCRILCRCNPNSESFEAFTGNTCDGTVGDDRHPAVVLDMCLIADRIS